MRKRERERERDPAPTEPKQVEAKRKRYGVVTAKRASGKERITAALGSIHNVEAGATRKSMNSTDEQN